MHARVGVLPLRQEGCRSNTVNNGAAATTTATITTATTATAPATATPAASHHLLHLLSMPANGFDVCAPP